MGNVLTQPQKNKNTYTHYLFIYQKRSQNAEAVCKKTK